MANSKPSLFDLPTNFCESEGGLNIFITTTDRRVPQPNLHEFLKKADATEAIELAKCGGK